MHRPFTNGPRSFIRTLTLRPVECDVTVTWEPNGLERCAAVIALAFIRSPDAVRPPPYREATQLSANAVEDKQATVKAQSIGRITVSLLAGKSP